MKRMLSKLFVLAPIALGLMVSSGMMAKRDVADKAFGEMGLACPKRPSALRLTVNSRHCDERTWSYMRVKGDLMVGSETGVREWDFSHIMVYGATGFIGDFTGADFSNSYFTGIVTLDGDFKNADFTGTMFIGHVNAEKAKNLDLSGASGYGIDHLKK